MNGASKSSSKRIVLDFKQKQKIIQEYDELVKRQGKVNKTKFAEKYGLSTILEARTGRWWRSRARSEGDIGQKTA